MKTGDNSFNVWVGFVVLIVIVAVGMSAPNVSSTDMTAASSTIATTSAAANTAAASIKPKTVDETVTGIVASLANGSRFAALLAATNVSSLMKGAGPYTVFVPSNAAYDAASSMVSGMSAAQKKQLAEYHVVVGRALDPGAVLSGSVQALSRDYLNFSIAPNGKPQVNSSYIVSSYKATNGIVYVISAVLFPPAQH
jgi:transforming growth factor-beta-induced protein